MQNQNSNKKLNIILLILLVLALAVPILALMQKQQNESKNQTQLEQLNGIVANIWMDESRLDKLKEKKIRYLFIDVGDINTNGEVTTPESEIMDFLNMIKEYQKANNYNFVLLPYSEIIIGKYILNEEFQENLISSHNYLIKLGFNGIFLDIEKIPFAQRQIYLSLLGKLNNNLSQSQILAVYAGGLNDENYNNEWEWDKSFYEAVADKTDIIVVPAYDTEIEEIEPYNSHISNQIKQINSIDAKAKFLLGIPTHKSYPETIENSMNIYKKELNADKNSNFIGISIFAEWTIDESEWQIYKNYFPS